jgi:hypothetical protein
VSRSRAEETTALLSDRVIVTQKEIGIRYATHTTEGA